MNITASLISLAVGVIIPGLVSLISKATLSNGLKALLSAMLSAVSGGLTGALSSTPHGWAQWQTILWSIALAWIAAAVSYFSGWKPSGAASRIIRATAHFGVGPRAEPAANANANHEAGRAPLGTAMVLAAASCYVYAVVALAAVGEWSAMAFVVVAGTGAVLAFYLYQRVSDVGYSRHRRH